MSDCRETQPLFPRCRLTAPHFAGRALSLAREMSGRSAGELEQLLKVSAPIAAQVRQYYQDFPEQQFLLPALQAYDGVVFKHIVPGDLSGEELDFAQSHLLITSCLYGLLRPLDGICNYRIEGDVRLPSLDGKTLFEYWKPVLTDYFIACIQQNGGVLVNLASGEMKKLFDWKRVIRSVRVVTPDFIIRTGEKLTRPAVYAKMCRGEMIRWILRQRIDDPSQLTGFSWEGFTFEPGGESPDTVLCFVKRT